MKLNGVFVLILLLFSASIAGCTTNDGATPDAGDLSGVLDLTAPFTLTESLTNCKVSLYVIAVQYEQAQQLVPTGWVAADFATYAEALARTGSDYDTGDGSAVFLPMECHGSDEDEFQMGITMVGVERPGFDDTDYDFYGGNDNELVTFNHLADIRIGGDGVIRQFLLDHNGRISFRGSTDVTIYEQPEASNLLGTTYRNVHSVVVDEAGGTNTELSFRETGSANNNIQGGFIAYFENELGTMRMTIEIPDINTGTNSQCNFASGSTGHYLVGGNNCQRKTTVGGYYIAPNLEFTLDWLPDTYALTS